MHAGPRASKALWLWIAGGFAAVFVTAASPAEPAASPEQSVSAPAVPGANASAPSANAGDRKLFLWRLSSDKSTVYLLGSIHLVPASFYPLPAGVESAFTNAGVLVVEVDESKLDKKRLRALTISRGFYGRGDGLKKHISAATLAELKKYLKRTHSSGLLLNKMRPWLVSAMVPISQLSKLGYDPRLGIDQHFINKARSLKKSIEELETAEFQLDLLSRLSDEMQDKLLLYSLLDAENAGKDADILLKAWLSGDPEAMLDLLERDDREHPDLKPILETLIYRRNATMAEQIEKLMKTPSTYFVVVGALHLIGDRGIIKLFQDRGYTVEQVSSLNSQRSGMYGLRDRFSLQRRTKAVCGAFTNPSVTATATSPSKSAYSPSGS